MKNFLIFLLSFLTTIVGCIGVYLVSKFELTHIGWVVFSSIALLVTLLAFDYWMGYFKNKLK